jgi:hypothetical protein
MAKSRFEAGIESDVAKSFRLAVMKNTGSIRNIGVETEKALKAYVEGNLDKPINAQSDDAVTPSVRNTEILTPKLIGDDLNEAIADIMDRKGWSWQTAVFQSAIKGVDLIKEELDKQDYSSISD